jgi:hypothetical protein
LIVELCDAERKRKKSGGKLAFYLLLDPNLGTTRLLTSPGKERLPHSSLSINSYVTVT